MKKLKRKVNNLSYDLEQLTERANRIDRKKRSRDNIARKIMIIVITISIVCVSIAGVYSVFFK